MKLFDLLEGVVCDKEKYENVEIESISFDAKEINKNGIFVCLKGIKNDGHKFAQEAVINGAKVLVVERKLPKIKGEVQQVEVFNARKALALISANFYGNAHKDLKIISITGTNGKTSSTYITKSILENAGYKVGMIGTNGAFIGKDKIAEDLTTPDPPKLHQYFKRIKESGCEYVVMEASAHAIFWNKLYGIKNKVLALTNVTQDHLDFFKTMEIYSAVKESYFTKQKAENMLVNLDDPLGQKLKFFYPNVIKTYALEKSADFTIFPLEKSALGSKVIIKDEMGRCECPTKLVGDFNLENIALAYGICSILGLSKQKILEGIEKTLPVPGRFNVFYNPKKSISVVVDYAHTPDGLSKVLKSARNICKGNLICVFGCGGNRDKAKRKIMGGIASKNADLSIITSDNPRFENPLEIIKEIKEGAKTGNVVTEENRETAIKMAIKSAGKDDMIVIAGKGAETTQEIGGVKYHFDDREIVKKYLCRNNKNLLNNENK